MGEEGEDGDKGWGGGVAGAVSMPKDDSKYDSMDEKTSDSVE